MCTLQRLHTLSLYIVKEFYLFRLCEPNEELDIAPDSVAIVRFVHHQVDNWPKTRGWILISLFCFSCSYLSIDEDREKL